ncbi:MAG: hypothetical protein CGW95_16515 [Phenylobacterium zucineum]|nr:MAG: hypothetical protein CGW95_16515 [Phenylobacterium zucineum]
MAQMELFTQPTATVSTIPTEDTIRARIDAVLLTLREARDLPWSAKEVARWQLIFPQMTDWLPARERDEKCAEFTALLAKLNAPV